MARFVGFDLSRATVQVAIVDSEGQLLLNRKLPLRHEPLVAFVATKLDAGDEVAVEATGNTWAVVDILTPHVAKVVVSNPLRTRAIASAKVKTDKVDARVLAELLRCRYLPEVWQPDATTRHLRDLTHQRAALVGQRTAVKNRIHAQLAHRLLTVPVSDLFGRKGLAWLAALPLDEAGRAAVDSQLRLLAAVEAEVERLDAELAGHAWREDQVRLLMTLPGVSMVVAIAVLAAWGDVRRFPTAAQAAAYLGLVPSTRQSGTSCYHGPITKQGASRARWLLVQAAQHLDRNPGPLGHFFRRLARRKCRNVAVVAAARKLAVIAHRMLVTGEPYRYALPAPTATKLAAVRVAATGERRRGGLPKGAPRPAGYGSGRRHRTFPGLPAVCAAEGLPAPSPPEKLPPGELRALRAARALGHARAVQRTVTRSRPFARKAADEPMAGAASAAETSSGPATA